VAKKGQAGALLLSRQDGVEVGTASCDFFDRYLQALFFAGLSQKLDRLFFVGAAFQVGVNAVDPNEFLGETGDLVVIQVT
jgi:hypothetical protein